uniref:Uncharacterized protein n=1 Tax=Romanomermis culicivorax TaxID=13658 RepID=A0A915HIE3_ROMCU
MATDMKNFQFTVPMPADSMASSYRRYIQLAFTNGMMFVFETFTATPEDWTTLFSLVDGDHTVVISFNEADDWGFIPEVCNAPTLFPQDSLDAAEIDHLAKTLIATFHSVMLMEVLPTEAINKIYLTISQIALPEIMQDELLSAYQIFMFDCASSNH